MSKVTWKISEEAKDKWIHNNVRWNVLGDFRKITKKHKDAILLVSDGSVMKFKDMLSDREFRLDILGSNEGEFEFDGKDYSPDWSHASMDTVVRLVLMSLVLNLPEIEVTFSSPGADADLNVARQYAGCFIKHPTIFDVNEDGRLVASPWDKDVVYQEYILEAVEDIEAMMRNEGLKGKGKLEDILRPHQLKAIEHACAYIRKNQYNRFR